MRRSSQILLGVTLLALLANGLFWTRGSHQEDGPIHFLFARDAWDEPYNFVNVWARPLVTLTYSIPALFGYDAARVFSLLILGATALLTVRVARRLNLPAADWAWLFLLTQPYVVQLSMDTMTEPLFMLAWLGAYALKLEGRNRASLLLAGALPLIRPEGLLVAAAWPLVVGWRKWDRVLVLSGTVIWWLAALVISGDAGFIVRTWPSNWVGSSPYGQENLLWYPKFLPLILGPLAIVPFALGCRRRSLPLLFFWAFFAFHTLLWWSGSFGSAGFPRYFVCVAPFAALIASAGLPDRLGKTPVAVAAALVAAVFAHVVQDSTEGAADPRALDELKLPTGEPFASGRAYLLARHDRPRTHPMDAPVVIWDNEVGERVAPEVYHVRMADIVRAGYRPVETKRVIARGSALTQLLLPSWAEHNFMLAEERRFTLTVLRRP